MATAKKTDSPTAPAREYRVVSRLDHDGETYLAGSTVDLAAKDAHALMALGVVAEMEAEAAKP